MREAHHMWLIVFLTKKRNNPRDSAHLAEL